jgi:hypothetical protein
MSRTWEENRAIVLRRWPDVLAAIESAPPLADVREVEGTPVTSLSIGGIQLTSAYDRVAEAREQETLVPDEAVEVWVYGLGLGDLPRRLLTRESLRSLVVVILNRALAGEVLARFDFTGWLGEPRVRLALGEHETELRRPFGALPGELRLASADCARLRDLVNVELAAPWVEATLADRDAEFARAILENQERLRTDGDVAELFGTRPGETVFVAAAGPTLSDTFELLRDRSGPLIAVDSALRSLLDAGVIPDVTVSVDVHLSGMAKSFAGDLTALEHSDLVYYPVVPGEVLVRWPGRRLVAYGGHARWAELRSCRPRGVLWVSGSVIHAAVDLAVHMGAARIVLVGCDFGYVGNKTHADGSLLGRAENQPDLRAAGPPGTWVPDVAGGRLASIPNLVGYLRELERYIRAHPDVTFLNASRAGAAIEGTRPAHEVPLGR